MLALTLALCSATRVSDAQSAIAPRDTSSLPADAPAFPTRVDSLFEPWRGRDRPGSEKLVGQAFPCQLGSAYR